MNAYIVLQSFILPGVALLLPLLLVIGTVLKSKLHIYVPPKNLALFFLLFVLFSSILSLLLLYLTGAINYFYSLEPGFAVTESSIDWKINNHIRILVQYQGGISLIVISILSSLIYASLLALPPKVAYPQDLLGSPSLASATQTNVANTSSTIGSSITSFLSAMSSTAVCCSTSVAAIIAPSVSLLFAPFVPVLLVVSFILLIYSFYKIVLPKFTR